MTKRARKQASAQRAEPDSPASKRRGGQPPSRHERTADELAGLANLTVGPAALADGLLMSPSNVARLAQRGVLVRTGHARYELVASITNYVRFLKAGGLGGVVDEETTRAKARLTAARAAIAEAEMRERADELVDPIAVEDAWGAIVSAIRSRVVAIPAKVAPIAHSSRTIHEAAEVIRQEVYDTLQELARIPVMGVGPPSWPIAGQPGKATA